MFRILPVFLRHGLMLVPMWLITFAAIAGWIGINFGFHNLFRDHPFGVAEHAPQNSGIIFRAIDDVGVEGICNRVWL